MTVADFLIRIGIILGTDALCIGFYWLGLHLYFRAVDKRETKELLQRLHAMDVAYQHWRELRGLEP